MMPILLPLNFKINQSMFQEQNRYKSNSFVARNQIILSENYHPIFYFGNSLKRIVNNKSEI